MRFLLGILLIIGFSSNSFGQPKHSFLPGEEITYDVYYNLAFVWVSAADVTFTVEDSVLNKKTLYNFKSTGTSKPSYDWIFKVRDKFEVLVEPDLLQPILYHRKTSEGSSFANNYYFFDKAKSKIYSSISNNKSSFKDTISHTQTVRDVLSSVYFLRDLDLKNFVIGDLIPITSVMDNELITLNIYYCGIEKVKHKNGKLYTTHKLKTKGIEGSIFDKNSEILVWVSADGNQIPIKVESEILVGSVQAFLKSVRKPMEKQSNIINAFITE